MIADLADPAVVGKTTLLRISGRSWCAGGNWNKCTTPIAFIEPVECMNTSILGSIWLPWVYLIVLSGEVTFLKLIE